MKALTVRQPWAMAIARLGKRVENRNWETKHRGELAIHASAAAPRSYVEQAIGSPYFDPEDRLKAIAPFEEPIILGRILCVVELFDIHHADNCARLSTGRYVCSPWAMPDQFHWQITQVRAVTNMPEVKGRLQLWDVDDTLLGVEA